MSYFLPKEFFMRFVWIMMLGVIASGCATAPDYNPMQVTLQQELLLNESGLKAVQNGMTLDQVHQIMGQELIIGYQYQAPDYKPLTIPNPYKTQALKGTSYLIEYYLQAINQPDGIIHEDQLMPLVFKDGRLVGRGWPLANSIRPQV
jgi:hypothetical protein